MRSFFVNYRRRYNLDEVLAEFEKENGPQFIKDEDDEPVSNFGAGNFCYDMYLCVFIISNMFTD